MLQIRHQNPRFSFIKSRTNRRLHHRSVKASVSPVNSFLINQSAVIGEGIIAFTFIYCSLNWFSIRRTRKELKSFYSMSKFDEQKQQKKIKKKG
jgi:hypothetical protein